MRIAFPLALVVILLFTPSVLAHAEPESSQPVAQARLDESPSRVFVLFEDRIDLSAAPLVLRDQHDDEVELDDVELTGHGRNLTAAVPDGLAPGGYVLRWEVISTTDGHKTSGTIAFGVGQNATIREGMVAAGPDFRPDAVVGKTLMFIGLASMAGTFAFWYLILPRGTRKGHEAPMERLGTLAGWTHIFGALVFGYSQWQASGMGLSDYFYGTAFGQGIGQRLFLGIVVLAGLTYAVKRDDVPRWVWGGTAFALFLLFFVYGRFSHTAGFVRPESFGVLVDAVHLLAISIWTGGLVAFVLFLHGLPEDSEGLAEHLRHVPRRFSNTSFGSMIVAAFSGILMLWAGAGFDHSAWIDSTYGYTLVGKVSLALVMIIMAGWNRMRYVRRYAHNGGFQTLQMFRANVQRELLVAVVVFVLAAIVTNAAIPT